MSDNEHLIIGFDAKRAFFNYRGLGNYSRNLLMGLAKYYPQNQYVLFSPSKPSQLFQKELDEFPQFECVASPQFVPGSLWRSFGIGGLWSKFNLDIYHGLSHEIPFITKKSKTKILVTIHDLLYLRFPQLFKPIDRVVYDKKFRYSSERSDEIIAVSQQTKNDLVEYFGVSPQKIHVGHQSCSPNFYHRASDESKSYLRKKYRLPQNFCLSVGALEENKNLLTLFKAMNILKQKLPFPLVVVGEGKAYKSKLFDYIQRHGLNERVFFINEIDNVLPAELPALYQMADLFIFPSHFEGFGIPIIESFFSHTPVITSKGSCFSEAGGEAAVYVDSHDQAALANAIEGLLCDTLEGQRRAQLGYEYVQKFHLENTTKELHRIYSKVLN